MYFLRRAALQRIRMKQRDFVGGRQRIVLIAGVFVVAVIALYSLYVALPFLMGPALVIRAETGPNGLVLVSGTTARVSYLALNNTEVPLNEDGSFSVERAYPTGYTWAIAEAKDRFGRTITKNLTFVVQDSHAQSQN